MVDRSEEKVKFSFNADRIDVIRHADWLQAICDDVGLGELNPQPYWGFKDLMYKAGTKLKNTFYVLADHKMESEDEYFWFNEVHMLTDFSFEYFLTCIEKGYIIMDFDARSGHNHGTKFRMLQNHWPDLYNNCVKVI